jgi:hypothetical protein
MFGMFGRLSSLSPFDCGKSLFFNVLRGRRGKNFDNLKQMVIIADLAFMFKEKKMINTDVPVPKQLLSRREAAIYLRVSLRQLAYLPLKRIQISTRKVVFDLADLHQFVAERKSE